MKAGGCFSFAAFCPNAAQKRRVLRASLAKAWASKDFFKDVLLIRETEQPQQTTGSGSGGCPRQQWRGS